MRILTIILNESKNRPATYSNQINADDFKKIALVLRDLRNLGVSIDKAIKEDNLSKSDWDIALGL